MATRGSNERNARRGVETWGVLLGVILVAAVLAWLLLLPGDSDTRTVTTPPPGNNTGQTTGSDTSRNPSGIPSHNPNVGTNTGGSSAGGGGSQGSSTR